MLAAVAFMAQLDLFIVNVAMPAIGATFAGSGLGVLSWILNGYTVVFAALLVPAGRLADQFGRRRVLMVGVVTFTAASVVCAFAPSVAVLVAGRAVQGAGAALIVPTSLGLLWPTFPDREHNLVVGIWAGVAAIAGASGPTVGGLLVAVDWRWIFLINAPIGVVTLVGAYVVVPEVKDAGEARLPDLLSAVALLAAVFLITLVTIEGGEWGWGSPRGLVLLLAALAAVALTVWRSRSHPHALLEARLFTSPPFTAATAALFLFFLAFSAWLLGSVLFLQDVWHYDALHAGLAIAPGPLMAVVAAFGSSRLAGLFGRPLTAAFGTASFAAAGAFWYVAAVPEPGYVAHFLPGLLLCGIGSGLTQAPLFAAVTTLPSDRATTGSAVLNTSRQIGSALGVAVQVALLGTSHSGVTGFRRGWLFVFGSSVAAAIVAFFGSRRDSRSARRGIRSDI
ncbi:MFS transporter [Amycolatopsis sp. NPDC047767]|uniref:MFS transporter n=1 Tax=Amycolatopsis sp. NPDC047767 TaxID=3156765 RepID=UPI0034563127